MEQLFFSAVGLGLAFSATPGAVNTESFRRGVARGFWPALLVQLGSLVGDMVWAAIALTGTTFLVRSTSLRLLLGVVGGLFLLRLALSALLQAKAGKLPDTRSVSVHRDFVTGTLFSITNPFALAFWLGIGAGITATVAHSGSASFGSFFAGFFLGALLWCVVSAAIIGWGRRHIGPAFFRWVNALCGATLGYFGLRLLWSTLRALRLLRFVRVFVG